MNIERPLNDRRRLVDLPRRPRQASGARLASPWPAYDSQAIRQEEILLIVQINGKVRSKITVARDLPEDQLKELVLKNEKVLTWVQDKPIKKFLLVPNKLVSIAL